MARWHTRLRKIWIKMQGMPETRAQMEERERMAPEFDKGKALMAEMMRAMNSMSNEELLAGMLAGFATEHRTLQQSLVRAFVEILQNWVTDDAGEIQPDSHLCDARNEGTYELAKRLVREEPRLPFV